MLYRDITAVVLAGGNNSRYNNFHKAFLEFDNETFYDLTKNRLSNIFKDVIIITNSPELFPDDNLLKYTDIIKQIGPLGGIHSALTYTQKSEAIFVTAIDMPFLSENIIETIIEFYIDNPSDILIPRINNRIEPLNAIYKTHILKKLEMYIKKNNKLAIRDFFDEVDTRFIDIENNEENRKAFININTPEEFDKLKSIK